MSDTVDDSFVCHGMWSTCFSLARLLNRITTYSVVRAIWCRWSCHFAFFYTRTTRQLTTTHVTTCSVHTKTCVFWWLLMSLISVPSGQPIFKRTDVFCTLQCHQHWLWLQLWWTTDGRGQNMQWCGASDWWRPFASRQRWAVCIFTVSSR